MKSEAQRHAANFRRQAIGPTGSSVAFGLERPEVFFKVHWTPEVKRLAEAIKHDETLDSTSQWVYFNTDEIACALILEWPGLSIRIVLYFEVPKFRHELDMIARSGIVTLVRDGWSAAEYLKHGIATGAAVDPQMWTMVLNR